MKFKLGRSTGFDKQ